MGAVDNQSMPEITGQTAIVIEDDDDIRGLLHIVLSQMGFSVLGADNGEEGLELARNHAPGLITLDIGLPGADGIEVLRELREFHVGPVVVVSARGREPDTERALDAGADGYIVKPFRPRSLREELERILHK